MCLDKKYYTGKMKDKIDKNFVQCLNYNKISNKKYYLRLYTSSKTKFTLIRISILAQRIVFEVSYHITLDYILFMSLTYY